MLNKISRRKKMSKKSRSEGNRVASAIKANKTPFYIADVDLEDNFDDVMSSSVAVRKTLGKCQSGYMLISAGTEKLIVVVDLLDSSILSASDWLSYSLQGICESYDTSGNNNLFAKAVIDIDTPFKLKDMVRSNGFACLRSRSLREEESEEEEEHFEI